MRTNTDGCEMDSGNARRETPETEPATETLCPPTTESVFAFIQRLDRLDWRFLWGKRSARNTRYLSGSAKYRERGVLHKDDRALASSRLSWTIGHPSLRPANLSGTPNCRPLYRYRQSYQWWTRICAAMLVLWRGS